MQRKYAISSQESLKNALIISIIMKADNFNCVQFMKNIVSFSPRQHIGEIKTADFIDSFLRKKNVSFKVHKFKTKVPVERKAVLKTDGKSIPCKSVSLVSGRITNTFNILSSEKEINEFSKTPAIIFNPYCKGISCSVFFHNVPALAICRKDVKKIKKAKKIEGEVKIKPFSYAARNILVGNSKNPKNICFAHYDCLLTGAWDNAGSVAVLMATILSHPQTLKNTLFVFTANEELSYDTKPGYWCYGFRQFESKYFSLLKNAQKIIVVDGVGINKFKWFIDYNSLSQTILIKNLKKFQSKIFLLSNPFDEKAKSVYHSDLDTISNMKKKYLLQTINELNKKLFQPK